MFSKTFGRSAGFPVVAGLIGLGIGIMGFATNASAQDADLAAAVEAADATAGQSVFRQCAGCHTVDNGGRARVGPNLWGIVDRDIGAVDGFRYSGAMGASEETWSLENLSAFLENPRAFVPGTTMGFGGLRNEAQRNSLLAYLQTLNDEAGGSGE